MTGAVPTGLIGAASSRYRGEFGTCDFPSGLDCRHYRLFGGAGVLPLGFFWSVHASPARAASVHTWVHTGLARLGTSGVVGGICRERSIPIRAARTSLPGWSSAHFRAVRGPSKALRRPKCAKGSEGGGLAVRRLCGVEDRWTSACVALFPLVRGLPVGRKDKLLRCAKDSLAPLRIGARRLTLRLEHGSTARQMPYQPQWTDARPLWTPSSFRGTVVRCLN